MASLRAAMSTTAGTPVKSWRITLLGLNGISDGVISGFHEAIRTTSSSVTRNPSHLRRADSSRIRIETGISASSQIPALSRAPMYAKLDFEPSEVSNSESASKGIGSLKSSPMVMRHWFRP